MSVLSKTALIGFEILNELFIAMGAGALGMVVLLQHGFKSNQYVKTISVIGMTAASLMFTFSREKEQILANKKKVVVITGCDSEIAGKVSLKHIYEIAKIKGEDPNLQTLSLPDLCKMVIGVARSCGIEVVPHLDAKEYGEFLKERAIIEEQQKKELQEKKEAKMLRSG